MVRIVPPLDCEIPPVRVRVVPAEVVNDCEPFNIIGAVIFALAEAAMPPTKVRLSPAPPDAMV